MNTEREREEGKVRMIKNEYDWEKLWELDKVRMIKRVRNSVHMYKEEKNINFLKI